MAKARGGNGDQRTAHRKPSLWEWAAAALGAAIVAATIGFMVYDAVTAPSDGVPKIEVRVDSVVAYSSGYVVEFRAINAGDATAASVLVQGELRSDTGVVERSEATVDFVPAGSWRPGGLVFTKDPRAYHMEVRPLGFDRP
jgi:uncharacterized protein (TIGR02588 family)